MIEEKAGRWGKVTLPSRPLPTLLSLFWLLHHHHLSLPSPWRMGPLVLLQAALSLAATSASPHPRHSSLFIVLCHISLGCPLLHLPLGARVSAILGFLSNDILKTSPSHFHRLVLTCSSVVHMPDLSLKSLHC